MTDTDRTSAVHLSNNWQQQQQQYQHQQQHHPSPMQQQTQQQQPYGQQNQPSSSVPFPNLLPASASAALTSSAAPLAAGPNQWLPSQPGSTPFPSTLPSSSTSPSPRVPIATGSHVAVPASLVFNDIGIQGQNTAQTAASGQAQGMNGGQGHAHAANYSASTSPPSSSSSQPHSHSHSHSHGSPSSSENQHRHNHSHGTHGHSHDHSSSSSSTSPCSTHSKPSPSLPYVDDDDDEEASKVSSSSSPHRRTGPMHRRFLHWLHLAWRGGGDSRNVLLYVALKSGFMMLQFLSGIAAGNLGLVSTSFHTGFDVLALGCALIAMLRAKCPAQHPYSYGFDRQEVVAAFTNCIFLFFVATFQIIETFHTAYFPPEVGGEDVVLTLAGLVMDGIGLGLVWRYVGLKRGGQGGLPDTSSVSTQPFHTLASSSWTLMNSGGLNGAPPGVSGGGAGKHLILGANEGRGHYENMHGVALHVVADLIGHSTLLASVWIARAYPSFSFIFVLSFLLSAVILIRLVLPLFQATGAILLLTTPSSVRLGLDRCIREISFFDGVLELRSAHWWTQAPGVIVGSLHLRIRSDAEEQAILTYVNSVLKKYCAILTVQIEKDQMPANWMIRNGATF